MTVCRRQIVVSQFHQETEKARIESRLSSKSCLRSLMFLSIQNLLVKVSKKVSESSFKEDSKVSLKGVVDQKQSPFFMIYKTL